MAKIKKKFIVQQKVNPTDEWKDYKRFETIKKARQSLATLRKHIPWPFQNGNYFKYRLWDRQIGKLITLEKGVKKKE